MKLIIISLFFFHIVQAETTDESGITSFPVELLYFNAAKEDSSIVLSWGTATENNNFGFLIERNINLNLDEWDNIGFVEGAGNSNTEINYSYRDTTPEFNFTYYYRLKQLDTNGDSAYSDTVKVDFITSIDDELNPVKDFKLYQNYPNPFNSRTTIRFQIQHAETRHASSLRMVTITIYDILGNEVATILNDQLAPGDYEVNFDAKSPGGELTSGIYFYTLNSGLYSETRKLILLK